MDQLTPPTRPVGVLVMEYGEPATIEEVEPYLRGHFGGQTPPADYVAFLCERCRRVWGADQGISGAQAVFTALAALLAESEVGYRVVFGARYWHPYIDAALAELASEQIADVVILPLSPFGSHMALRDYQSAMERARAALPNPPRMHLIEGWADLPGFTATVTENAQAALERFPAESRGEVVGLFIAHSVAESARKPEDAYRQLMEESGTQLASALGLSSWRSAYYSAEGPGQWLGPDVLEAIDQLHQAGARQILAVPISATYDNVELNYELDVRMADHATALGIAYERAGAPNAAPAMIVGLRDLIIASAQVAR
ncbi:MAG: ferrochelatase [Oscillochloris sp.]|nr:ferrochelatase [Oscillochloris sp.]